MQITAIASVQPTSTSTAGYKIISLENFADLGLVITHYLDLPDYRISEAVDEDGNPLVCIQGNLTGLVTIISPRENTTFQPWDTAPANCITDKR